MNELQPPLLFARENGIARLTLNRPKAGNAIDVPLARALMEAAIECDEDESIRVVTLTGAGRLFCGGGDVGAFAGAGERFPALLKELTAYIHSAVSRFSRMGKPMVTIINGPAAGAGFNLSLLGDIAIAAQSAHFTTAYTGIGLDARWRRHLAAAAAGGFAPRAGDHPAEQARLGHRSGGDRHDYARGA